MKSCTTCAYRRYVTTIKYGRMPYCLHPRAIDPRDGVAKTVYAAREVNEVCGPQGHLHSDNDVRTGYVSAGQWRTTQ